MAYSKDRQDCERYTTYYPDRVNS